jgi:hypothetical protein
LTAEHRAYVGVHSVERPGDDGDLSLARHEDEHVAVTLGERTPRDVRDMVEQSRVDALTGSNGRGRGGGARRRPPGAPRRSRY